MTVFYKEFTEPDIIPRMAQLTLWKTNPGDKHSEFVWNLKTYGKNYAYPQCSTEFVCEQCVLQLIPEAIYLYRADVQGIYILN